MLTSELTDEQLARLAAADNVAALEELVARYLKPVYGFVRSFVYDADVADDITQEVFVKVWKHISRYDTEQPFRPWLYIIAKRTTFDFLKKKTSIPFSVLEGETGTDWLSQTVVDTSPTPDALVQSGFEQERVNAALSTLSPKYASVVNLYYKEGLKFREIAARLKEPINTVKSRYRRALAQLKELL